MTASAIGTIVQKISKCIKLNRNFFSTTSLSREMLQNSRFIRIYRAFNTAKIALFGLLSEGRTKDGNDIPNPGVLKCLQWDLMS
jgi:hypothetical protein